MPKKIVSENVAMFPITVGGVDYNSVTHCPFCHKYFLADYTVNGWVIADKCEHFTGFADYEKQIDFLAVFTGEKDATVEDDLTLIASRVGYYINLGGMGIMDGLKIKSKSNMWKIIGLGKNGLVVKGYRHQRTSYLPFHMMRQSYEIFTAKEFAKLPVYA